jgi:sugar phosphate isomerase/epimerase
MNEQDALSPLAPLPDLARLCVHTMTTKPWSLDHAADAYARAGVRGITVWRDALAGRDVARAGEMLRSRGLSIVSLCRGGFFPHADAAGRQKAHDDNRQAIDEAAALGAPLVVLVCGAVPGQSLARSREQIRQGIEAVLPHAEANQIRLAIEPLHPMYADSRSAINTLAQANDLALELGSDYVGVAVDVYHLWWDPALESEILRAGRAGKLFAYHVCDWKTPTQDLLLDRGLPGEGCIPLRRIRGWMEAAGFRGFNEVEIFSRLHWASDQAAYLERIVQSYRDHV